MLLKHMSLHVVLYGQIEGPRGKCACARAFLGIILPQKHSGASISAYADPGMVVKDDLNVGPAEAAERCESVSPGAALEGRYGSGTTVD
jgi:hypothetical protein